MSSAIELFALRNTSYGEQLDRPVVVSIATSEASRAERRETCLFHRDAGRAQALVDGRARALIR